MLRIAVPIFWMLAVALACGLMTAYIHVLDESVQRQGSLKESPLGQKRDARQQLQMPLTAKN